MTTIDHLVVAAPDLDGAVAWFADRTGVEPSAGGSHDGVGTRNSLVSLGGLFAPPANSQTVAVSPEALFFTHTVGGAQPADQTIFVSSSGPDIL